VSVCVDDGLFDCPPQLAVAALHCVTSAERGLTTCGVVTARRGDHYNFIGQGSLFTSPDNKFDTWTRKDKGGKKVMDALGGGRENSGQWMMPVPKAVDGSAPPSGAGAPNVLINVGGGDRYVFATWDNATESLTPWTTPAGAPKTGQMAHLEGAHASWWGASGGTDNNGRMMMIGWATPDFHGDAGPGIKFLTRLTGLREVNYDPKAKNLVANPVPELKSLRGSSLASMKAASLSSTPTVVKGTAAGAAASADVEITFSGAKVGDKMGACVLGSSANATAGIGITITVTAPTPDGHTATVAVGHCGDANIQTTSSDHKPIPSNAVTVHAEDGGITLRMMPDRSLADFFVQGGQWAGTSAWTSKTPRAAADSEISVWASGTAIKADIDVWSMGCGWLNPSYTDSPTI
jgi:hypothetical protein